MKQKLLLLLTALMLLVTGNAWGATSYLTTMTGQVGTNDNAESFYYATKKVKIAAGESYVYTLTNYNNGNNAEEWKNWLVEGNLGGKYFDCEARGHKWQAGGANEPVYTPVINTSDVANWQTAYNGATVTVTISRNTAGDQFTITHTSNVHGTTEGNTEKYYGGTFTVAVGADEDWDIYLTEENSHFVVTKVVYTNASGLATNYELKNVDLSLFDTYFAGSYSDGAATFTKEGTSKQWAKLSLSSYFSGITGTITNVNMKLTENMNDGGRMTIGIYGNDKISWATNGYQDTEDAVSAWGLTGSNSTTRIYYTNGSTYATGVTLNSATEIEVDMDVVNGKFTWIQAGTTKVNNQNYCSGDVSIPQYFALYSWSGTNTTTISNMTMEIVYLDVYTCTVNAKAGDLLLATKNQSVYSGDDVTIYYQKAYSNAGKWYFVDVNGSAPGYGVTFSNVSANQTTNVTTYEAWNDVVYFGEAEDMTIVGSWAADGAYLNWRSNGGAKRMAKNSYIYTSTIAPGVYEVTLWARNQRSSGEGTETLPIFLRDGEGNLTDLEVSFPGWARGGFEAAYSARIAIPDDGKAYSVVINNNTNYNSNLELDYVYLTKLPATVSKTITAAGWATYCSPYILDFSSSIANLTAAYIITGVADSKLTLVEVDGTVPANTGLLLKGEGECIIPVVASSSTDVSSNKLEGVTSSTPLAAEAGYVLMGSPTVGFYKNSKAFTLGANTAYLPAGFDAGARTVLYLDEDDAPTAINAIEAAETEGLKDGKYFIGNKIILVKNGVKYSANGQILK